VAQQNTVRGTAGAVLVDGVCPSWKTAPDDVNCVRVRVYRDGSNQSTPLNTLFANLFGVSTQGVRATATAQVLAANTVGCVRPYYIPDNWVDADGDELPDVGEYTDETRFKVPEDIGTLVTFHDQEGPGAYGQLAIGGNGTQDIIEALLHCAPSPAELTVGVDAETTPGDKVGQKQGIDFLMKTVDPNAAYNPSTGEVEGGCSVSGTCNCAYKNGDSPTCPYDGKISPRIIIAPLCNPLECYGVKNGTIEPIGILAFFLESVTIKGNDVELHARLIKTAGNIVSSNGTGAWDPTSSFTYVLSLVQ
jgi:hypothetical protein